MEHQEARPQMSDTWGMTIREAITGLSEPAERVARDVIQKLSDAIGLWYQPVHIRRMAEAEADAAQTATLAAAEISHLEKTCAIELGDLERRAIHRRLTEDVRHQQNIENIVAKALPELGEKSTAESLKDDWIRHFFEKCRNFSEPELQLLWAKILAGEAEGQGTSKKTLSVLSDLSKADAEAFQLISSFVLPFQIDGRDVWNDPLVLDISDELYASWGIRPSTLWELDSLGLVVFRTEGFFLPKVEPGAKFNLLGLEFNVIKAPSSVMTGPTMHPALYCGMVRFTNTGRELYRFTEKKNIAPLLNITMDGWMRTGYQFSQWQAKTEGKENHPAHPKT